MLHLDQQAKVVRTTGYVYYLRAEGLLPHVSLHSLVPDAGGEDKAQPAEQRLAVGPELAGNGDGESDRASAVAAAAGAAPPAAPRAVHQEARARRHGEGKRAELEDTGRLRRAAAAAAAAAAAISAADGGVVGLLEGVGEVPAEEEVALEVRLQLGDAQFDLAVHVRIGKSARISFLEIR